MRNGFPIDLVVLVPGKDEKAIIEGLLQTRILSLGIRSINFEILVHPHRDPGCYHTAQHILQPYIQRAEHSLVIFDHEGSGQEKRIANEIVTDLTNRLANSGWGDRVNVLVIEPELEVWVWTDSPHVDSILGWHEHSMNLRTWLSRRGLWPDSNIKPHRPKECLLEALREVRVHRSSAIYRQLAEKVSLNRCQDQAFNTLKDILKHWFPME